MTELSLSGIDGGNPLGFLAAVGTALAASRFAHEAKLGWRLEHGAWRPVVVQCGSDESAFAKLLHESLMAASDSAFRIDSKLPFPMTTFLTALRAAQASVQLDDRRLADFLAAFGSEACADENVFEDSLFRMVRSGDSAGQGLPAYALTIRAQTNVETLQRTLFEPWDYRDDGSGLRWDPIEDQRYALRWYDPSPQANKKFGPRSMRGANALALEALTLFPAVPTKRGLATTGFSAHSRREFFTWPIWECPITPDAMRSLLALADLQRAQPSRTELAAQGVVEIYRCQRIAANQYYRNFAPAAPA